jgi:hypothetical protein
MNLVDCYITEIIGEPYFKYDFWFQKVKYDSHGVISETELFDKEKDNLKILTIGFKFLQ